MHSVTFSVIATVLTDAYASYTSPPPAAEPPLKGKPFALFHSPLNYNLTATVVLCVRSASGARHAVTNYNLNHVKESLKL